MKRKIILAAALCLAAALSIGAAPALAADGCDCHTAATPIGGAPEAHTPFVAGVADCTTCHAGWTSTTPHPGAVAPKLSIYDVWARFGEDDLVSGRLTAPRHALNGVVIYLQQRAPGASRFSDVAQTTTFKTGSLSPLSGVIMADAPPSTTPGARYRAVSQGVAGATVVMPGMSSAVRLMPELVIKAMRGLNSSGRLRLGGRVVAIGRASPTWVAGEKVKLALKKLVPRTSPKVWRVKARAVRVIKSDGTFRWKVRPKTRGMYYVTPTLPASPNHRRSEGFLAVFTVVK